jgi:hypothetical protein
LSMHSVSQTLAVGSNPFPGPAHEIYKEGEQPEEKYCENS